MQIEEKWMNILQVSMVIKLNDLVLYLKNLLRKRMLIAEGNYSEIFIVKVFTKTFWEDFWFKKGETYIVRKYPLKATKEGTATFCNCNECLKIRKGKKLYGMYEVISGKCHGSLIPIKVCKIIEKVRD